MIRVIRRKCPMTLFLFYIITKREANDALHYNNNSSFLIPNFSLYYNSSITFSMCGR